MIITIEIDVPGPESVTPEQIDHLRDALQMTMMLVAKKGLPVGTKIALTNLSVPPFFQTEFTK